MRKILIIVLILLAIGAIGLAVYLYVVPKFSQENRQIDTWISENNLNHYGDLENTVYSNEKPCSTTLSCYDYIKKMNPDKPWEK